MTHVNDFMHKRNLIRAGRFWYAAAFWTHSRAVFGVVIIAVIALAFGNLISIALASGSASWTTDGVIVAPATNGFLAGDQENVIFEQSTSGPVARTSDGYNVYVFTNDAVGSGVYAQKVNDAGAAQWGSGVEVYDGAGGLGNSRPRVVADTSGGVIVVYGTSSGTNDIYAQRLDSSGAVQWAAGGLPVANVGASSEFSAVVLPDGSDGIFVAYNISNDVRAQRLNGSGAKQWTATGVVISAAANGQLDPLIATDGSGGAIIAWEDNRGADQDLYAQRVNSAGTVQWTANGVAITTAGQSQDRMTSAVPDGSGGIVVAWEDSRTGSAGVYAQRLNGSGSQVWTANGVQVSTAVANPNPKVAMSGTDAMVFYYNNPFLIVQKLNASGAAQFSGSGLALTSNASLEDYPAMAVTAGDGSGDVLIAVMRQYSGASTRDVIAQRVNSDGTVDWASGGVLAIDGDADSNFFPITGPYAISTTTGDLVITHRIQANFENDALGQLLDDATGAPQFNGTRGFTLPNGPGSVTAEQLLPRIAADGSGNYFLAWNDGRHNRTRVFLQKVNASGVPQWTVSGVPLVTGIAQEVLGLLSDGSGGVYVVWKDYMSSERLKIKRFDATGATAAGWSATGIELSPPGSTVDVWGTVTDGANGAIVMYEINNKMYGVRATSAAAVPWGATGVEVSDPLPLGAAGHEYGAIASDGAGGAYLAWQHNDSDVSDPDLRVVRLAAADGSLVAGWANYGEVITTEDTATEVAISGVSGGVVVVWDEDPGYLGNANVKAQMYETDGDPLWTAGGVNVVTATDAQTIPKVVASDTGSIVVWKDFRSGANHDVYAQRLNASGVPQWTANGEIVSDAAGNQGEQFDIATDNGAGVVVAWKDTRSDGSGDVYAQRLSSAGAPMWTADGLVVANRVGFAEDQPKVVSNGNAGIVTAFQSVNGVSQTRAQMIADSDGAPTVAVTAPNGGESLTGGASSSITWTNTGLVDHYRITLSTDGGSTFPTLVTASDAASPFSWTVDDITTTTARIRIEAQDAGNITLASDVSNANFSITASGGGGGGGGGGGNPPPAITVSQPNGGEQLAAGSAYSVFFTTQGSQVQNIRLSYSVDNESTYAVITSSASPSSGIYAWTVPSVAADAVHLRAEALGAGNSVLAFDVSNSPFKIIQNGPSAPGSSTTTPETGSSTTTPETSAPAPSGPPNLETRVSMGVNVSSLEFPPAQPAPKSRDVLTYRIDIANRGGEAARNVRLTDIIPPGTTYRGPSLSINGVLMTDEDDVDAASWNPTARIAEFDLGDFAPGETVYAGFSVAVLPGASTLTNRARVEGENVTTQSLEQTTEVDRTPEPEEAPASVPQPQPPRAPEEGTAPPVSGEAGTAQPAPGETGGSSSEPTGPAPETQPGSGAGNGSSSGNAGSGSVPGSGPTPGSGSTTTSGEDGSASFISGLRLSPIEWIARSEETIEETPILDAVAEVTKNVPLIGTVSRTVRASVKAVRVNETAQTANEVVVTPATTAAVAIATTTAVGFGSFARYAMFLLTQPISLLDRRKRKGYGTVYNVGNKLPVDLAIVRLLDATGEKVIATRVTDRFGRYLFLPTPGAYALEIRKPGFTFPPTRTLSGVADGAYEDLHVGGVVTTNNGVIAKNIPLEPTAELRSNEAVIAAASRFRVQWAIASIGPGFALASYAATPRWEQVIALVVQILFMLFFVRITAPQKPKYWGTVADTEKKPVGQVVVRIVESAYNKVLEARVTDARGRYAFLAGQNRYFLTAERAGYQSERTDAIDFTKEPEPAFVAKDIELKPAP